MSIQWGSAIFKGPPHLNDGQSSAKGQVPVGAASIPNWDSGQGTCIEACKWVLDGLAVPLVAVCRLSVEGCSKQRQALTRNPLSPSQTEAPLGIHNLPRWSTQSMARQAGELRQHLRD